MAKKSGDGTPSKMAMVRDALGTLGPDAKPLAIQAQVKEAHKIVIPTTVISSYKNHISKGTGTKGKPGRKAGRPKTATAGATTSGILDDIAVVKGLVRRLGIGGVRKLVDVFDE